MDSVFVEGLELEGFHGFYDAERNEGNNFRFDVRLYLDTRPAGNSDELDQTVDYSEAVGIIRDVVGGSKVKLVEALAEKTASSLMAKLPAVVSVHIKLSKLHPPLLSSAQAAGVEITRSRGA
ncbi:MAG: dihydroneopterin aldolase [Fimbriimonadales bacterium]